MLVISPSSPSVMAVTKNCFFPHPPDPASAIRAPGDASAMPFLGLMGCKRFIQLSKEAVVRLKSGAGYNLQAHPAV